MSSNTLSWEETSICGRLRGLDVLPPGQTDAQRLREIELAVGPLLASWQVGDYVWERRHRHRTRFSGRGRVRPLEADDDGARPAVEVRGRDVSLQGVSFCHAQPLPYRMAEIELELAHGLCVSFATRLTWCRFTKAAIYESGGQFLRVISKRARDE